MSKPEKLLKRNEKKERDILDRLNSANLEWVQNSGYKYLGSYTFQQIDLLVWRDPTHITYLLVYLARGRTKIDIASELSEKKSLTTGNAKDGNLFPTEPEDYKEILNLNTIRELYEQHSSSIQHLGCSRLNYEESNHDFESWIIEGIRNQMRHVRSHFLWPIRFWGWYIFRRNKLWNKTIEQRT